VGLAGGHFRLQTRREELLVAPGLGAARSASRSMASRRVGAFSARVRYASSAVTSRLLVVLAAITLPARQGPTRCRSRSDRAVRPQRGNRVRQRRTACSAAV
jgi:hypothetical protein